MLTFLVAVRATSKTDAPCYEPLPRTTISRLKSWQRYCFSFKKKNQCQTCNTALKLESPHPDTRYEYPVMEQGQLVGWAWQFLLVLVPGWFGSSHKQGKNLFHVAKCVFQAAAPVLTRWCDLSAFWDASAPLIQQSGLCTDRL